MTRLKDGSIGLYVEVGPDTNCSLYYYHFNHAWLQRN